MAGRIMARPQDPESPDVTAQSPEDLLENKLSQLHSLPWCCHGAGNGWLEEAGPMHRDQMLWIAADLAQEAMTLFQACARSDMR